MDHAKFSGLCKICMVGLQTNQQSQTRSFYFNSVNLIIVVLKQYAIG